MGMSVGPAAEEDVNSSINTTPLVDVMLVLLIIFLITVPVVAKTIDLDLPIISNEATQTKPENIIIAVDKDGKIYWNDFVLTPEQLLERMRAAATQVPQPEVHIRGDVNTPYRCIGGAIFTMQRAGFARVGFISEPPPGYHAARL